QALLGILRQEPGSGIVYAATVRKVEELWPWLRESGLDVDRYHGRLRTTEREESQRRFMSGETRVMVATSAFGLGIDKPDIRFDVAAREARQSGRRAADRSGSRRAPWAQAACDSRAHARAARRAARRIRGATLERPRAPGRDDALRAVHRVPPPQAARVFR